MKEIMELLKPRFPREVHCFQPSPKGQESPLMPSSSHFVAATTFCEGSLCTFANLVRAVRVKMSTLPFSEERGFPNRKYFCAGR